MSDFFGDVWHRFLRLLFGQSTEYDRAHWAEQLSGHSHPHAHAHSHAGGDEHPHLHEHPHAHDHPHDHEH